MSLLKIFLAEYLKFNITGTLCFIGHIDMTLGSSQGYSELEWQDPDITGNNQPRVHGLSLSTGPGNTGEWQFKKISGKK